MKKALTIGAAAAAIAFSSSPADAHASYKGCSVGRDPATYKADGGYTVVMDRYRGRKMHCSSVRYVINRWIRRKVARQSGHPHLFGPFFDGYVVVTGALLGSGRAFRFSVTSTRPTRSRSAFAGAFTSESSAS